MHNNPLSGAVYFLRGMGLIFAPGIRAYVIVPLLVNIVLFSAIIYFGAGQFLALLDWMLPDWLDWLTVLLMPLFFVTALIVVFFMVAIATATYLAASAGLLAQSCTGLLPYLPLSSSHLK